jgi:hypothetical protein
MRVVADFVGWAGGWICSDADDEFWDLCVGDSVVVMRQRELFSRIAQDSVFCCPTGWCSDMFEGLGAHTDPLWFRRPGPDVVRGGIGFYDLTSAECIPLCRVVDRVCGRFPDLYRSGYFRRVLALFVNFLETSDDAGEYLLGLPIRVELLVLRSQMLLGCHRGFVRWLGDYLPSVPVNPAGFSDTPADFLGVDGEDSSNTEPEMWNFGEGGLDAVNDVSYSGVPVPLHLELVGGSVSRPRSLRYDCLRCDSNVVFHSFVTGELMEFVPLFY